MKETEEKEIKNRWRKKNDNNGTRTIFQATMLFSSLKSKAPVF